MKVLFPTPGTPVIPMRQDLPVFSCMAFKSFFDSSLAAGVFDSIKVKAEANAPRFPASKSGKIKEQDRCSKRSLRLSIHSLILCSLFIY